MKKALIILLFSTLLAGCRRHHDEPSPDSTVALTVALTFEADAGVEQFVRFHESLFEEGYAIRYIVDLYRLPGLSEAPLSERVHRFIATEAAMPANGIYRFSEVIALPAARYHALVWVDFVPAGSLDDYYYHTGNLQAVTIDNSRPYRGYHISKDAFAADLPVDLANQNTRFEAAVQVKRPFALYRIVATDVQEYRAVHHSVPYATIRPDTTRLLYEAWFPTGYNAYRSVPDNFDNSGVHYAYQVPGNGDNDTDVELAADFVFVNSSGDFYYVGFDVLTPSGASISRHSHVRVNLQRNRMTVIRGDFLTTGSSPGGAGIDFDFDEEIVIFI